MRVVIVACLPRSGSSVVARVLEQRFGIDMGGPGLVRPENPEGVYERGWQAKADKNLESGRIGYQTWAQVVRPRLDALEEPFGLKHPMNTGHIGVYLALFPDAVVIRTKRDRDAVADSWHRTYGFSVEESRQGVDAREAQLDQALKGTRHLTLDMTDRRTDEELVSEITGYEWLIPT